jgi:plastocyanin
MSPKKIAMMALVVAAGAAALVVPRATHEAVAMTNPPAKGLTVSIVANGGSCTNEFCFSPANLTIRQAQTVTWNNTTSVTHTVTSCTTSACSGVGPGTGTDPTFNSGFLSPGGTFVLQFHGAGTYNYYCMVHGYLVMHGTITVKPFAVKTKALAAGVVGQGYTTTLSPNGGVSPYTWTVVTGTLPRGLKLSTAGVISGTPKASGTSTFTVKVKDSSTPALLAQRSLSIQVT